MRRTVRIKKVGFTDVEELLFKMFTGVKKKKRICFCSSGCDMMCPAHLCHAAVGLQAAPPPC